MAKEKGFIPIIIIIVAAIAVLGAGGYIAYKYVVPQFRPVQNNQQVVGGDKDEHGCIGSAGYSWCEAKQKCLRIWEEKCDTNILTKDFVCDDNKSITTSYDPGKNDYIDVKLSGGRELSLKNVSSASGAKYTNDTNESFVFWSKGVGVGECTAFVLEKINGGVVQTYTNCKCTN